MKTIENLNSEYVKSLEITNTLKMYKRLLGEVQNDFDAPSYKKVSDSVRYYSDLVKAVDCSQYEYLNDVVEVAKQFQTTYEAIRNYRSSLHDEALLESAINTLKTEQEKYNNCKVVFEQKYGAKLDDTDSLMEVIVKSLDGAIDQGTEAEGYLRSEAHRIISQQNTVELQNTDPLNNSDELPVEMIVASRYVVDKPLRILEDIGIKQTTQDINADLRTQGNVIVHAGFKQLSDERIDDFIISYIFRFIESFPLGSANVHIFDQNPNHLYRRLCNCFQSSDNRESTKNVVQLHTKVDELARFRDVVCEDVFRKIGNRDDLYELYDTDKADAFNLVVLRRGLATGEGYLAFDTLDLINTLSKPGDIGHRCGIRFLIVDSSDFVADKTKDNKQNLIERIYSNCQLNFTYTDKNFSIGDENVVVLYQYGDRDKNILTLGRRIAEEINNAENSYIPLSEIWNDIKTTPMESIIRIPVGKSGDDVFEMPLSCQDDTGTPGGTCVGYMAIGQTGSGKSSLFHSIVINGCMKYTPDDLQFWLLDFKFGGSSSKYSGSGIPHIRYIAENNSFDDAICLFQMILEEMERRVKSFNSIGVDNLISYNRIAENKNLERFPRIIIMIDEVQEVLRDSQHGELKRLIGSIASRMRSAGIHFIMFSQNLAEMNSNILKESFMSHASGRVCFRTEPRIPAESGFGEDYTQRKQEISELRTGEAYVSYGAKTIKKVRMAFIKSEDMEDQCFALLRKKYPVYAGAKPLVIGTRDRLSITSSIQGKNSTYYYQMNKIVSHQGIYEVLLGEDVYRMTPIKAEFSTQDNSTLVILGTDKQMSSSLCTSAALSLKKQMVRTYLINGDISASGTGELSNPFMKICLTAVNSDGMMTNHVPDELKNVVKELYVEYLKRQEIAQKQLIGLSFEPIFLVVNDLLGIVSFRNNITIESKTTEESNMQSIGFRSYGIQNSNPDPMNFSSQIQSILSTLAKDGYRYNIHLILAIKGEPGIWRSISFGTDIQNTILINENVFTDQFSDSFSLKSMLKSINNENNEETLAVFRKSKSYTKIRPIIYKLGNEIENRSIEKLSKG